MSTEDGVLMIGGETTEAPVRPPPPPPARRPLVLGVMTAVAIAVAVVVSAGSDPSPTVVAPADLEPPVEPPPTPTPTETPAPELEWTGIRIPGTGVVTNVAAGAPGWLAVLLDDRTRVVTSTDGRTWRETPLGAPALGYLPLAASGAGVMVVAGSVPASATPFASWVSDDAGLSWTPVAFPDDALTLSSVSSAPAGVYATGSRRSEDGGSEPVVWWLEGGPRWTPFPVRSDGGAVVDLVDADGVALAVGYDDGPRLWTMVGREFVPLAASLPDEVATARPLGAVVDGDDRVVILLQQGLDGPLRVVRSTEAGGWELVGKASYTPVSAIGAHEGDPVVLGDRAHRIAEDGLVDLSTRGQRFLGLDSRSGLSVGGGFELDLALRLWFSGDGRAPVEPVLVTQPESGWSEAATGPGRVPGFLRGTGPGPRAVATSDGALISGADRGRVMQARITPSGVELGERSTAGSVVPVGDETWILGRALTRLEADGTSETLGSPDGDDVAAVAEIEGTTFVADAGGDVFELTDVGWELRAALDEDVPRSRSIDVRGSGGAFMARRLDDPSVTLVWSGGETWESVAGTLGASMSGTQFLVRSADLERSVIDVIGEWPETTRLEVPDPYPLEVVSVDGQIRVLTPTQILLTGDAGISWDSLPLGTIRGTVMMLPTAEIAIVSIDTDRTRILVPDG